MPHAYDCLATLSFACLWSESTRPSSMSLNSSDVATAGMTFSADAVNPAYKPRMPWARNTRRAACQPDLIPPVASSSCICLRTVSKGCVCQAQPNTHSPTAQPREHTRCRGDASHRPHTTKWAHSPAAAPSTTQVDAVGFADDATDALKKSYELCCTARNGAMAPTDGTMPRYRPVTPSRAMMLRTQCSTPLYLLPSTAESRVLITSSGYVTVIAVAPAMAPAHPLNAVSAGVCFTCASSWIPGTG